MSQLGTVSIRYSVTIVCIVAIRGSNISLLEIDNHCWDLNKGSNEIMGLLTKDVL